jgi:putative glycerol-1-phosphate prenyltransferase
MKRTILETIQRTKNAIAVLIDPEKSDNGPILENLIRQAEFLGIDFLFVGGSSVTRKEFELTIKCIKKQTKLPIVIFPGSSAQLSKEADAILYLSLLSGRNPDFLIGHHIQSAMELFEMSIEVMPTAYILIDGGTQSSVAYMSQTTPIPREKLSIVKQTALAGKFQGKQIIYLDAGSGAKHQVPAEIITALETLHLPLIVGGGIRTVEQIRDLHDAGASIVVIGNKLEEDSDFLLDIHLYKKNLQTAALK